jgi:hypothetical protein
MGRKNQRKKLRKIFDEAKRLEVQEAKPPCTTCWSVDPECWVADRAIGQKLLTCLRNHDYFFCHDGLSLDAEGHAYQAPVKADGAPDRSQMTPCGGFIRWAAQVRDLPTPQQEREVRQLQRHFLERFMTMDQAEQFRDEGFDASDLQAVINYQLYMQGLTSDGMDEEEPEHN